MDKGSLLGDGTRKLRAVDADALKAPIVEADEMALRQLEDGDRFSLRIKPDRRHGPGAFTAFERRKRK